MSDFDSTTAHTDLAPLNKRAYEKELKRLQTKLVEMQQWVIQNNARVCIVFEGRDAAGKGSAIKRITEYLNPRHTRIAALPTPTEREKSQWYFQRYVQHLPAAGEIVIFDRSWYNRAGVERVMGYCTNEQYLRFLRQAPEFERMLVDDGIQLIKYWFSVSPEEQLERFRSRADDPMRHWKLSPMDTESIARWDEYSDAKDAMMQATDLPGTRWVTVESDDKKRSRINVIHDLLHRVPWKQVEQTPIVIPDRHSTDEARAERTDRSKFLYAEDVAEKLVANPGSKGSGSKGSGSKGPGTKGGKKK